MASTLADLLGQLQADATKGKFPREERRYAGARGKPVEHSVLTHRARSSSAGADVCVDPETDSQYVRGNAYVRLSDEFSAEDDVGDD